jgi:hypothetical protein
MQPVLQEFDDILFNWVCTKRWMDESFKNNLCMAISPEAAHLTRTGVVCKM